MVDQILWINALTALVPGILLLTMPKSAINLLGLPRSEQSFYARMLGIMLLGFAAAILVEGRGHEGLGIHGAATFNLVSAAALLLLLLFGGLVIAKRGRWVLRGITVVLLGLGVLGMLAS